MTVTASELKPEIGVEITGLHGEDFLDPEVGRACLDLLEAHGVVVYRGADVDDDQLVAFSRLLGEVHIRPNYEDSGIPELFIVSLDPGLSSSASVLRGTMTWHIDGTTQPLPQRATLLSCRSVSSDGSGDTEFANTYAAYDALTDAEKAELDGVLVEYGYSNEAHRNTVVSAEAHAVWESVPQVVQPVVWTRRNGRRSMLLGSTAGAVVGWDYDRGRALLERLLEWSTQPRFTLRHHWQLGDLVVWDNTGMMHRALPYEPESHRLMHRTVLVGEEAVA